MNLPKRVFKSSRWKHPLVTSLNLSRYKDGVKWKSPPLSASSLLSCLLCAGNVSASRRTAACKGRGKKEHSHRPGFHGQLIPWPLIPVNFNRLMPAQCYLSFMGWIDFISLFLSVKGLAKVMVISLNGILMAISQVKKLQDVQEISINLLSQVALAVRAVFVTFLKEMPINQLHSRATLPV